MEQKKIQTISFQENQAIQDEDIYVQQTQCGNEVIYEVKEKEMKERLHKFIVAIVWRSKNINIPPVGRGSGVLISPNLVLTVAHNFYHEGHRVQDKLFELFIGHSGKLKKPYRIEAVFIPKNYDANSKKAFYDYALIKLADKYQAQNFISLGNTLGISNQKLAIFGYPFHRYMNCNKKTNMETVNQWGLIKQNSLVQIKTKKEQILHCVSTQPGQSGSPIICVQDLLQEKLTIVGIHNGAIQTQLKGQEVNINSGRLISQELIVILLQQSQRMRAERFIIEKKQTVANNLIKQGNKLWQANKQSYLKVIDLYLSALKVHPDYGSNTKLKPFIQQFQDKQKLIGQFQSQLAKGQSPENANLILGLIFEVKKDRHLERRHKEQAVKSCQFLDIGWNTLATYHYQQQQYHQMADCLKRAIAINPQYSIALSNLGVALKAMDKVNQAIDCFRKATAINPQYASAFNNLGNALKAKNKFQEAVESYRKAIKISPQYSQAHYNLAVVLSELKKKEEAIECYNKAVALNPKYKEAKFNSEVALLNYTKKEENTKRAETASSNRKKKQKILENQQYYFTQGIMLKSMNQVKQSIQCFNKAIQINPRYKEAYYNLGVSLCALGQMEKAIECYHKAIQIDPRYAVAYANAGDAYFTATSKIKSNEKAVEYYRKAIEINPLLQQAYSHMGVSLNCMGKLEQAIECFRIAIKINPYQQSDYNNYGQALTACQRYEEALECYRKALKIKPNYANAYSNMGCIYLHLGQLKESIQYSQKAIKIDPYHVISYNNLGETYQQMGDMQSAIKYFHKALSFDSSFQKASEGFTRALIYFRLMGAIPKDFERYF